jgi:hypothetical protein
LRFKRMHRQAWFFGLWFHLVHCCNGPPLVKPVWSFTMVMIHRPAVILPVINRFQKKSMRTSDFKEKLFFTNMYVTTPVSKLWSGVEVF